jgi:hypothetical protein
MHTDWSEVIGSRGPPRELRTGAPDVMKAFAGVAQAAQDTKLQASPPSRMASAAGEAVPRVTSASRSPRPLAGRGLGEEARAGDCTLSARS